LFTITCTRWCRCNTKKVDVYHNNVELLIITWQNDRITPHMNPEEEDALKDLKK